MNYHYDQDRNHDRWYNPLWDAYWVVYINYRLELSCHRFLVKSYDWGNSGHFESIGIKELKRTHKETVRKFNAEICNI